jgi:hypothetical protein
MLSLELGGKERNIRYDSNSICVLEEKAGMGIPRILSEEQMGFNTLRLLLWAGCRHENQGLTLDMVGIWMEEYFDNDDENKNFSELLEKVSNEFMESKAVKKLIVVGAKQ